MDAECAACSQLIRQVALSPPLRATYKRPDPRHYGRGKGEGQIGGDQSGRSGLCRGKRRGMHVDLLLVLARSKVPAEDGRNDHDDHDCMSEAPRHACAPTYSRSRSRSTSSFAPFARSRQPDLSGPDWGQHSSRTSDGPTHPAEMSWSTPCAVFSTLTITSSCCSTSMAISWNICASSVNVFSIFWISACRSWTSRYAPRAAPYRFELSS